MQFELKASPRGSTGPWRRKILRRLVDAAARATDRAAFGARDELRAAMRAQRLGGLANVVGATSDLKKRRRGIGGGRKIDVAGYVFSRAKSPRAVGAMQSYVTQDSTEITPNRRGFLWIATNELQRTVGTGTKRRRLTPGTYRQFGLEQKLGPLQFIPGKNGAEALLVIQDVSMRLAAPGRLRGVGKSGRVGRGRARVGLIAFVGIRRTRRQRRVAPREIGRRWQRRLSQLLTEELA